MVFFGGDFPLVIATVVAIQETGTAKAFASGFNEIFGEVLRSCCSFEGVLNVQSGNDIIPVPAPFTFTWLDTAVRVGGGSQVKTVLAESAKDDTKDEDGNGVADVNEVRRPVFCCSYFLHLISRVSSARWTPKSWSSARCFSLPKRSDSCLGSLPRAHLPPPPIYLL